MAAEERCPRSDLPKSMCAHCRGHGTDPDNGLLEVTEHRRRGFSFTASYPGRCEVCPVPIRRGDEITRVVGSDGYAHDDCIPLDAR